ncbi:MAG: glycosyltransferase family 1 protein [Acidimicrobiia bacterium]|nr:glycosyltransferase family 1 protein [Acidimicrobiia bacterium]
MRVAIVAECFLPAQNGVTNSVVRVLEAFEQRGVEATVITSGPGPDRHGDVAVRRVPGVRLPFYKDLSIALPTSGVRRALEAFGPDVVHLAAPAALGALAVREAERLGVPVVSIYQTDYAGFAPRYRAGPLVPAIWQFMRRLHENVDVTLAPSTAAMWKLRHHGIDRVALWGRGVDLQRFNPVHRTELQRRRIGRGQVVVGYVGRLAREKRVDLLRHAAMPGVRLVVVGDGPDRRRLEKLLPDATFLGFLGGVDLSRAIASLDVFVHTGADETFCQGVQEALSSGVPVVAPARGGPLDLVRHGENGFLYPPDDVDQLTGAVQHLVGDAVLRARLGIAARHSVKGRTWAALSDQLLGHYESVLRTPTRTRTRPRQVA